MKRGFGKGFVSGILVAALQRGGVLKTLRPAERH